MNNSLKSLMSICMLNLFCSSPLSMFNQSAFLLQICDISSCAHFIHKKTHKFISMPTCLHIHMRTTHTSICIHAKGIFFFLFFLYPCLLLNWMFEHDCLDTCCFGSLIWKCFVFLYLHLFNAPEHPPGIRSLLLPLSKGTHWYRQINVTDPYSDKHDQRQVRNTTYIIIRRRNTVLTSAVSHISKLRLQFL